jgi:hypothetical protein
MTHAWAEAPATPDARTIALARACLGNTQTEWGASRWGEYRRCHKAHHLRYHLRLSPTPRDDTDDEDDRDDTGYFEVGKLVASAHQFVREGIMADEARDWRHVLAVAAEGAKDLGHVYEAERLLTGYYGMYGTDNGGFPEGTKILAVEHEMHAPEGSIVAPYSARADAIVQLQSGEIVIVDDKTRSQAFPKDHAKYARGAATRPQFAGLSWLLRENTRSNIERQLQTPPPNAAPSVWINAIIKTKCVKVDRILVPMTHEGLDAWAEAQARDARGGCNDDSPNYNSCAPEIGSRCWAFTYCHPKGDERERHFQTRGEKKP